MKRVLCIGDSLGLPREGVEYHETWFVRLQHNLQNYEFISFFRRNATTEILSCGGDYGDTLLYYHPQIIILQLGICDCAPRYFKASSLINKILYRIPQRWKKNVWGAIKVVRKRKLACADVSEKQFYLNLINYMDLCKKNGVEKIIAIKIAMPASAMIHKNPLIVTAISRYNKIYDDLSLHFPSFFSVINPLPTGDAACFVADGYHPNSCGNKLIADEIIRSLVKNV